MKVYKILHLNLVIMKIKIIKINVKIIFISIFIQSQKEGWPYVLYKPFFNQNELLCKTNYQSRCFLKTIICYGWFLSYRMQKYHLIFFVNHIARGVINFIPVKYSVYVKPILNTYLMTRFYVTFWLIHQC